MSDNLCLAWDPHEKVWCCAEYDAECECWRYWESGDEFSAAPTHFQPLPDAPEATPGEPAWVKHLLDESRWARGDIDEAVALWDAAGEDDFAMLSLLIARVSELGPCPMCGAHVTVSEWSTEGRARPFADATCDACDYETATYASFEDLAAVHNRLSEHAELWRLLDAMLGDTGIVSRLQRRGFGIQYPLPKTVEGFVEILREATQTVEENE